MLTQKLDNSTRLAWELHKSKEKYIQLEDFYTYVENRCTSLETMHFPDKQERTKSRTTLFTAQSTTRTCKVCNQDFHYLYACNKFLKSSYKDRVTTVQQLRVCKNCLRPGHRYEECHSGGCKKCNAKHNTLLHPVEEERKQQTKIVTTMCNYDTVGTSYILLSTVLLNVETRNNMQTCRALLDNASQSCFITTKTVKKLGLKPYDKQVPISGIDETTTTSTKAVRLTISSRTCRFKQNLEFLVIEKITNNLPSQRFEISRFNIPNAIKLADPQFNQPAEVDILIGGEIFFKILGNCKWQLGPNLPYIQDSAFGWIIAGKVGSSKHVNHTTQTFFLQNESQMLNEQLSKFWKIEHSYDDKPALSLEEKQCEQIFKNTTTRNDEGRYIVKIPLKEDTSSLGNSYDTALKRLHQLEKRFLREPEFHKEYKKFMSEYSQLNHMQLAKPQKSNNTINYLPHHGVFKTDLKKIRVVFDGSMQTDTGKSYNDIQLVGPTLYQELFMIVLRFRKHRIAFTCDIKKMYRQILIHKDHIDLQRILWREDTSQDIQEYQLLTVTYGTASAPYLATKCIKQLTQDEQHRYPTAAYRISQDTYVDDIMTGGESVEEALKLQTEIVELLNSGGFELHKWCSNSKEVLSNVETNNKQDVLLPNDQQVKTLGLIWSASEDTFSFTVNIKENLSSTKRTILSDIATIFDPLGLIGPITLAAKIIMQELWKLKISWDDQIPTDTLSKWIRWREQLHTVKSHQIQRRIVDINNPITYEVHGFSDASQIAYGAAVYLKSLNDKNETSVNLICSKSRVAPIKTISLPRLELNGALTLAKLVNKVISALEIPNAKVFLWTDSTIVLSWINNDPNKWTTFVANRVSEIQELTNNATWLHVPSEDNPADCLSRGLTITQLQEHTIWWHGPDWLSKSPKHWPKQPTLPNKEKLPDMKAKPKQVTMATTVDTTIFDRYSNYNKLVRVIAYCLRFINNTRKTQQKYQGPLHPTETHEATHRLIKIMQTEVFWEEIQKLEKQQPLNKNSKLLSLNPYRDENGILRVGGRIQNSTVAFEQKHPIILPQKHKFTRLIIQHEHKRLLHAGPQAILASLRRKYWPINARNEIRQIVHKCITCFRFRAQGNYQLMANLPRERVQETRPFLNTGLDYGGPIFIKTSKRKNAPLQKTYIALFICLATRAIHLELVGDLSTEGFLLALNRFISRRGICSTIFSDNGTNFKGAQNELQELAKLLRNQEFRTHIKEAATEKGITWKFIPPNAPHFGGIWEAGIKSTKYHLKRTMGKAHFGYEETYTLLTEIEACLNSRPLVPISTDPTSYEYLTPAHFLIGDLLTSIPMPDMLDIPTNRLSRYQHVQKSHQEFWKHWSRDYLNHLQQRHKWQSTTPNLQVGRLVLVKEDNLPPLLWVLARIKNLTTGPDGNIRVATVTTSKGAVLQRPIVKLCPLPIDD